MSVYRGKVTEANPGSAKPWLASLPDGSAIDWFAQQGEAQNAVERPYGRRLTWTQDAGMARSGVVAYRATSPT